MTLENACQILGIAPGTSMTEIKKRYRQLMLQLHPDMNTGSKINYAYHVHEINEAYALLKKDNLREETSDPQLRKNAGFKTGKSSWDAPVNEHAYCEREILHYAEDSSGSILGSFCIAKGKYLWKTQEDFPLFLLSIYRCSKNLLDEVDQRLHRTSSALHSSIQPELAQKISQDSCNLPVYYLTASLEFTASAESFKPGELLYPAGIRRHRLYLKKQSGKVFGYLSFPDDRLYYVIIPLLEQRIVQTKIQISSQPSSHHQKLDLWIRFSQNIRQPMPENLNLQIQHLLNQYEHS